MDSTQALTTPAPHSAAEIRAQVQLIQQVMAAVMKDGTHYGTIPGTSKPTLYKAGSEKILSTFRIAVQPEVLDLSTYDEARFRVIANASSQQSNAFLGSGVGECSSNEEKYKWRAAVCQAEWDETPEDRRRDVWKGKGEDAYRVKQVRTNPADVANTVLKMAKKRAQIDMTLTVTAASDVFAQDLEDLPAEIRQEVGDDNVGSEPKPAPQPPQRRATPPAEAANAGGASVISEPQQKRLYAIAMGAGWDKDGYTATLKRKGFASDRDIPRKQYESIVAEMQKGPQ